MDFNPIKIVFISEQRMLVELFSNWIHLQAGMDVVGVFSDPEEGLTATLELSPDVVVLDSELPGRGSFELISDLNARKFSSNILILATYLTDVFIEQALKLGVRGFLMNTESLESAVESIKRMVAGETVFSKEIENRLVFDSRNQRYSVRSEALLSSLTNRQIEVLRHLAMGRSVKEVAKEMFLSPKSVDSHKYRIMNKLDIHDRVELTRYSIREGLVLP